MRVYEIEKNARIEVQNVGDRSSISSDDQEVLEIVVESQHVANLVQSKSG